MEPLTPPSWESGRKPRDSDPCVCNFTAMTTTKRGLATGGSLAAALALQVDDVLLAGGRDATLDTLEGNPISRFEMSDIGDASLMLVVYVTLSPKQDRPPSPGRAAPGDCP